MPERRTELRREEDEVLAVQVGYLEKQIETLAPLVTQVAVHEHQLDEGSTRMRALETGLQEAKHGLDELLACINAVKVEIKGITVRLGFIVGIAALVGGGIVTAIINLTT